MGVNCKGGLQATIHVADGDLQTLVLQSQTIRKLNLTNMCQWDHLDDHVLVNAERTDRYHIRDLASTGELMTRTQRKYCEWQCASVEY